MSDDRAPRRPNPLKLNPLQLKTLVLLQELARLVGQPEGEEGDVLVDQFPHAHGDHFHLGDFLVAARDATGLGNPSVWVALERKGLIRSRFPQAAVLSAAGLAYDTGVRDQILHHGHH